MMGSDTLREPATVPDSAPRTGRYERSTTETSVAVDLNVDGTGSADIRSGIGFLDHLVTTLARHARWDLAVRCDGDLHVDDHHTAEDVALQSKEGVAARILDRVEALVSKWPAPVPAR